MKKLFLVEADTDYFSLAAYELTQGVSNPDSWIYSRPIGSKPIITHIDPALFFGKLNELCITKERLENAKRLELVTGEND